MAWTIEAAKENPLVKTIINYYNNESIENYLSFEKELLKYKYNERYNWFNSATVDVFTLYLSYKNYEEFCKWSNRVLETCCNNGIIIMPDWNYTKRNIDELVIKKSLLSEKLLK
jgi:hypothetical protein